MNNRTLLIVDDDPVFSDTLARSLTRKGLVCVQACDRASAMHAAQQQHFTDITVDLNLGDQSGLQLIAPLRALQPQATLLVLTGYASIATTVQAMRLGADNYLAKPVDGAAVLRALDDEGVEALPDPSSGEVFQPMSVSRMEWEHIQRVLNEHGGNVSATARALNMHRRTLQRKLAKRPVGR